MNPSPWPEGLRLGPQSSPARSPARAGTHVLWGASSFCSCAGVQAAVRGSGHRGSCPLLDGDFRKTTLPAPLPRPPLQGPAPADVCLPLALGRVHGPDAAAGCRLGRGPGAQSLPLRTCPAVLVTVDGALGL